MVCRSGSFCGCYMASRWARVFLIRTRPRCFRLKPVLSCDMRSLRPWHILITLLIFGASPVSAVQTDLWTIFKDRPLPAPFIPASQSSGSGVQGGKQSSREQDQPREKRCGERLLRMCYSLTATPRPQMQPVSRILRIPPTLTGSATLEELIQARATADSPAEVVQLRARS